MVRISSSNCLQQKRTQSFFTPFLNMEFFSKQLLLTSWRTPLTCLLLALCPGNNSVLAPGCPCVLWSSVLVQSVSRLLATWHYCHLHAPMIHLCHTSKPIIVIRLISAILHIAPNYDLMPSSQFNCCLIITCHQSHNFDLNSAGSLMCQHCS